MKRSRYALAAFFGFLPAALGAGPSQCRPLQASPPAVCPLERADENPLAMVHPADLPDAGLPYQANVVHPADLPQNSSAAMVQGASRVDARGTGAGPLRPAPATTLGPRPTDGGDEWDEWYGCDYGADEWGCFRRELGGCGNYPSDAAASTQAARGALAATVAADAEDEPLMAPPASLPRDHAADVVAPDDDCGCFDGADQPTIAAQRPQARASGCNDDDWYWYEYDYEYGMDCFGAPPAAGHHANRAASLADLVANGGYDAGQQLALQINEENDGLPIAPLAEAKHPADLSVGYGYTGTAQIWYELARAAGLQLPDLEELQAAAQRAAQTQARRSAADRQASTVPEASRLKRGLMRLGGAVQRLGDALRDTLASLGEVVATAAEVSAETHPADLPADECPASAAPQRDERPGLCRRPAQHEYERTDIGR
jgi:hypothetical protein